jgi:hypothetical protein
MDELEQLKRKGTKPGEFSYETEIDSEVVGWAAAEIERLRAALDPFARHAHCVDQIQPSSLVLWCEGARLALRATQPQPPPTEP